ncbi:hypothetical protein V5799_030257, partial [Amblyomma americanum]
MFRSRCKKLSTLNWLKIELGIISQVSMLEYATPAVPVIKQDGSIRICGNYNTTVNPFLDVDRYPLPKVDDLFTALSG